jgi:hypothetical protein
LFIESSHFYESLKVFDCQFFPFHISSQPDVVDSFGDFFTSSIAQENKNGFPKMKLHNYDSKRRQAQFAYL